MAMLIIILLSLGSVLLYVVKRLQDPLRHMPGPPQYPIIGCLPHVNLKFFHLSLTEWHKLHGPVYRTCIPGNQFIVVGDYEGIREVLVTSGKQFAGREGLFRQEYLLKNTGIAFSFNADSTWSLSRKACQKHFKQFSEGMSQIQNEVTEQAEDVFDIFQRNAGKSFDPQQAVLDTTLNTLAFMITGIRTKPGDAIVEKIRNFEEDTMKYVSGSVSPIYSMFDAIPWLRHIARSSWKNVEDVVTLQTSIWHDLKNLDQMHPEVESLYKILKGHAIKNGIQSQSQSRPETKDSILTEVDIEKTIISLLLAGFATMSTASYATINILAHSKNVQDRIWKEISKLPDKVISLKDRPNMPYTRAVLFELMRYISAIALGVGHRSVTNTRVGGFIVPENSIILTNTWALHHDPDFWENPYGFHPERFLDLNGKLVSADHPNRRHLMPFGAGPRVCVGESLAMSRLFLWISTLVQRFEVVPAEGNLPSSADSRTFIYQGVVKVEPYEVCFLPREEEQPSK